MKPVEGGGGKWKKVGKEGRTANVCGDNVGHDLVTPGMFQSPDAEDSDVETPGEGHVTVHMTARNFDPAEEIVGELSWHRFVVWHEWNVGFDTARGNPVSAAKKRDRGTETPTFR